VLGVVGVVLGVVWAVASVVWTNYQVRSADNQIMTVVQNVRDYYDPQGHLPCPAAGCTTTGIDVTGFLDGSSTNAPKAIADLPTLIPVEMRTNQSTAGNINNINHALASMNGGSFHVWAYDSVSPMRDMLRIKLLGLSQEKCEKLLINFPVLTPEIGAARIAANANFVSFNANGTITSVSSSVSVVLPLTLSIANNWCVAGNTNEVDIDFKLRN